jgi:hypothetical protein
MGEVIVLGFAAPCASCGTLLRVGDTAFHDATVRRQVWCLEHAPAVDDPRWTRDASTTTSGVPLSALSAAKIERESAGHVRLRMPLAGRGVQHR